MIKAVKKFALLTVVFEAQTYQVLIRKEECDCGKKTVHGAIVMECPIFVPVLEQMDKKAETLAITHCDSKEEMDEKFELMTTDVKYASKYVKELVKEITGALQAHLN